MEIIKVETKEQLKELYDSWAMTWEGLDENDFKTALQECCKEGENGTGYLIKGSTMNKICYLTGDNAYPNDLNLFSIKNFKGIAMMYGARWMADIIDNNARVEKYHPFK